ncbi:glycoside hydrolase family 47 protein [Plectosphaerella cucumerina]|uniref:alpha-1,2-Mannosidase n=1 Tax=Plectosphaerella cucumerina TaxID=40658 RepID=A0A8K0TR76_9PEZI|nr:glycoside hydrolase family 47 protein [Plectosphaerella cucumerina]
MARPHPGPRWPWRRVVFRESSFDWNSVAQRFPVDAIRPLPKNHATPLRRIQHDFSADTPHPENVARRKEVREAFLKSWRSYKAHAWGLDELRPMSGGGKNTFGGYAATLVDALDTLWIMDLRDEFYDAAAHAARIDWADTKETAVNLFETNIRHLGGLLSAYDLSGERALLRKARELGDMLYLATDTPNRMPGFWANFEDMRNGAQMAGTSDPSAAPGSLSLEFTRLSQLTGDPKYHDAVDRIKDFLASSQNKSLLPGMWPRLIDFRNQRVEDNTFTLGALADSLYEYLPKMHALLGGRDPAYEAMYRAAMDTVKEHILFRPMLPEEEDVLFAGDARVTAGHVEHIPDGQHLACFAGGMFALGGRLFAIEDHVALGDRLARGCAWAYAQFPAAVMPELFTMIPCKSLDGCGWDENLWDRRLDPTLKKSFTVARDTRYILRPEAAESLFLLYRITGNQELQDLAWRMFKAILAATDAPLGNSAIADVRVLPWETIKTDSMESFWLAETLKYFYLIFSPPDLISLDDYVFNTEAHPLRLTS